MVALVGRFIRTLSMFVALIAFIAAAPIQAAPFAAIVMDARSGEILYEKNANTRLHPASLTKMMTLYITFQEIEAGRMSLDTVVTVSKNAAAQPPSRLGLKQGQKIKVRYLIRAAAIKSANDAASALGDHIGGNQANFAKRMTKTARALGMRNSTFQNAHGLTAQGHLSSAYDMNVLGRHLFYDFPQYYNIFSRRSADAGVAKVNNTNTRFLDAYEGADGIKTGYTVAAGFNLTASAKRGDKRIIATVFGGASTAARNSKMRELMDIGFANARNRVREAPPAAAPIPPADVELPPMAQVSDMTPGAEGGVGKTVRLTGEVRSSLRPRANPGHYVDPSQPDDIALAIAASVQESLTPVEPPPADSFEGQALALAEAETEAPADMKPSVTPQARPELPAEAAAPVLAEAPPPADTLEAQAAAMAALDPNSLEAQAAALAANPTPVEVPAELLAEIPSLRPQPRPAALAQAAPVVEPAVEQAPAVALAEAAPLEQVAPAPETVASAPANTFEAQAAALAAAPQTVYEAPSFGQVTEIETVSAPTNAPIYDAQPTRQAPIFESVQMADASEATDAQSPVETAASEEEELVVVSKSTSGGSNWSVNVGAYTSRYEAERALLKTGLAESATLDQGTRKITEKGGKYRASFLGLNSDQAELACRRLRARGMVCETNGPA